MFYKSNYIFIEILDLSKEYRSHSLNDLWTMRFIA